MRRWYSCPHLAASCLCCLIDPSTLNLFKIFFFSRMSGLVCSNFACLTALMRANENWRKRSSFYSRRSCGTLALRASLNQDPLKTGRQKTNHAMTISNSYKDYNNKVRGSFFSFVICFNGRLSVGQLLPERRRLGNFVQTDISSSGTCALALDGLASIHLLSLCI